MVSNPFHCLTLSLLVIPPLLITTYLLAAFPHPPTPIYIHKSLASLPADARSWAIYPENFYPGGGYVSLPFGAVLATWAGEGKEAMIWRDVAPKLASRGYRVLVYDLYGRGYSDAPQTTYDTNLYTTQLALLMQHLRWDKAIVAGVSMGGGIASAFTAQFPHLVDEKLVLIASAGLMEAGDISRTAKFMSSPLVQIMASSKPVQKYLQRLVVKPSSSPTAAPIPDPGATSPQSNKTDDPITEIVRLQSAHLKGYNAALSSSLRDGPIRGQAPAFSSDGFKDGKAHSRAVLIIHGTKDNTVHPRYAPLIFSLLPEKTRERSKVVTLEGAGHDLTISHGEEVANEMFEFFEGRKL